MSKERPEFVEHRARTQQSWLYHLAGENEHGAELEVGIPTDVVDESSDPEGHLGTTDCDSEGRAITHDGALRLGDASHETKPMEMMPSRRAQSVQKMARTTAAMS